MRTLIALCLALLAVTPVRAADDAREPYNVVFFLVDDLGWADVGCFGSTFHQTPHIDALAASGMRFTHGYAACPVCSPTRASIMTGRHPVRVDITDWIPGANANRRQDRKFEHVHDRDNLALDEVTLAEALGEGANYQTFFAGKWHLGDEGHWPKDQGFEFNIGGNAKGSPPGGYYAPWTNPTLIANEQGEYLTDRLTAESENFLETRDAQRPFLLYLSYYNVHTPITPWKENIASARERAATMFTGETPTTSEHGFTSRARQDNPEYASMVAAVDNSVGRVLAKLDELKLDDNTAVFFFSDNGGLCTLGGRRKTGGPTCNLPLRSGKGWLYEGGVREPTVIRVPGVTKAGSVSDVPVVSMDFFPTILDLAGVRPESDRPLDGVNLLPLLSGQGSLADRDLFWHYPHYHGSGWAPGASIRSGDWKLIELYHYGTTELYNLKADPGEQQNVADAHPDRRDALRAKLKAWQSSMQAKMPQPVTP